ncbi:unnamed protein product [Mycetohabitans rhizoxinica HKI 454]|uniref:Uncharacterized protein n=1 Tax=Mycetohabitans rhizoxinica (strain DSM 19002 / CIP 109453 / HKI 454) TaxID=882378 RepID=E5ASM5_MYCRK|nr:unnamed protein product [Mycetohabitans rhizoxinica HKI 454]
MNIDLPAGNARARARERQGRCALRGAFFVLRCGFCDRKPTRIGAGVRHRPTAAPRLARIVAM